MILYIITGISSGIGAELIKIIEKRSPIIGLTSKIEHQNLEKNIIYFPLDKKISKEDRHWLNLKIKIINFQFSEINIIFNSAVYDNMFSKKDELKNILNINFYNQINIYNFIKESDFKITKLIYFSSFEIYNQKSRMKFYKESKKLWYNFYYDNLKKETIHKLFVLGGIRTESYIKNTKNKKHRKLISFIVADTNIAAKFIAKKIKSNNSEVIFYPKLYFYFNKFIKIFDMYK